MELVSFAECLTVDTDGTQTVSCGEVLACTVVPMPILSFEFPSHKNFRISFAGSLTVDGFVSSFDPHCD